MAERDFCEVNFSSFSYNLVFSFLGIVSVTVVYNPFLCFFFLNTINGILLYKFICNFLFPLNFIVLIFFFHVIFNFDSFTFTSTWNFIVCIFSNLLSVDGHLGSFQSSFTIINNAVMNTSYGSVGALASILSLGGVLKNFFVLT